MRSFTTAMTRPIVCASISSPPASPYLPPAGSEKSISSPSRIRPRDSSWLLMYTDAVRRFSESIIAAASSKTDQWLRSNRSVGWTREVSPSPLNSS